MESISEIIDHQTFSQDLVEDATDFITVGHHSERQSQSHHQHQEGGTDSGEDLAISLQTMTACPRSDGSSGGKKHRSGPGSRSGSGSISLILQKKM